MDETDIRLIQFLLANSRQPYRDLAEKLGLTVQAVHRRIQALLEAGVIRRFTTHLSIPYLGAVPIYISGLSKSNSLDRVLENLGAGDSVALVTTADGNMLFTQSILRSVDDIESQIDFVKKAADMPEPLPLGLEGLVQVGEVARERRSGVKPALAALDYRIIRELRGDSRKAVADIAKALGVSAKTVARRLDRMTAEGVLEFTVETQTGATPGSIALVLIVLGPGVDRNRFRKELKETFGIGILLVMGYTNIPDVLFALAWAPTNVRLSGMVEEMSRNAGVKAVRSHMMFKEYQFETWRDRLVAEKAGKG